MGLKEKTVIQAELYFFFLFCIGRKKMTDIGCPEPTTALIILQMHREGQRR